MFKLLESIGEQVVDHTTGLGTVWYILVFGFRLFCVSTVGGAVYGDEQGAFQCSEKLTGCTTQCYNQFTRISHIRFWAFQIIAVSTPTVFFHLYCTYVTSQINKIEAAEEAVKKLQADAEEAKNEKMMKEVANIEKRRQRLGQFKMKEVIRGSKKIRIPQTKKIIFANLINLVIRLILELVFIISGAHLFNITDNKRGNELTANVFFWNSVPGFYYCEPDGEYGAVTKACAQHFDKPESTGVHAGVVPCFVSRAYEKTVLLRYMNIIAFVCVIITMYEIVALVLRATRHRRARKRFDRDAAGPALPYSMIDTSCNALKKPHYEYLNARGNAIFSDYELGEIHAQETKPETEVRNGRVVRKSRKDDILSNSMYDTDNMSVHSSDKSRQKKSHGRN